ncbi:hypothetical protein BKA70DRAFT_1216463 [Coprinopsis sp. MPI-PUGE-AT-0042]|nr:hypothetical protein BKA70DRAFT_1216463 [Coprinopsis sp. MPI-PUGE-AT-0042]
MSFGSQVAALNIDVSIVGAGISGLATGFALARSGHRVRIFEKHPTAHERSVGVRIPPNMSKILYEWGLQEELAKAQKCLKSTFLSLETNEPIGILEWQEDVIKETGGDFLLMHYDDIYAMLHRLATDKGVEIILGADIKNVYYDEDRELPVVELANGRVHHSDIVIGADGYNSTVREVVTGQPDSWVDTGMSFYTIVVPTEKLRDDPDWSKRLAEPEWPIFMGDNRNVLGYPIRNGQEYCVHAYHPDSLLHTSEFSESWRTVVPTSSMDLQNAHPSIHRIFGSAPEAVHVKYRVRDIVEDWVDESGTIVLIGEAAHALMPCTIHNLSLAVEDAAVLGVLMSHLSKRSQISQFLEAFQDLRFSRVQQVSQSELNNAGLTTMPPGDHRDARDAALGKSLLTASGPGHAPTEWNDEDLRKQWDDISYAFGYDASSAAEDWWLGFGRIAARSEEVKGEYNEELMESPVSLFTRMQSYHALYILRLMLPLA